MRDLSGTDLEAAQIAGLKPVWKIVLDGTTYTDSRVIDINHTEEPNHQGATVVLNNGDNALTDEDYKGVDAVISYGYGAEYSATIPLKVISHRLTSTRTGRGLLCFLELEGLSDIRDKEGATVATTYDRLDTNTVQDLIDFIAGGASGCYSTHSAFTVNYDGNDTLIDVFKPKDSFRINLNDTRQDKIRELLEYTQSVGMWKANGEYYIFVPTTTGETYAYQYSLASGSHNFYSKSYQKRLVLPNYFIVSTHPEHEGTAYSGYAVDTTSYELLPFKKTKYLRLDDDDQGEDIAKALLARAKINSSQGSGIVPMNVGAEVYDYVEVTDSREGGSSRTGNIGYINRHCAPGVFEMSFSFGKLGIVPMPAYGITGVTDGVAPAGYADLANALNNLQDWAVGVDGILQQITDYLVSHQYIDEFLNLSVTQRFQGPSGPNMYT